MAYTTTAITTGFKIGDKVIARGEGHNAFTGVVKSFGANYGQTGSHILVVDKDKSEYRYWSCKVLPDGRVASGYGMWDGKTYLEHYLDMIVGKKYRIKDINVTPFSKPSYQTGDICTYLGNGEFRMKPGMLQCMTDDSKYYAAFEPIDDYSSLTQTATGSTLTLAGMHKMIEDSWDHTFPSYHFDINPFLGGRYEIPKGGEKKMTLQKLTDGQKKGLSLADQALIELGIINNDLELDDESGYDYVIEFMFEKFKLEIGTKAIKDVVAEKAELKKRQKDC